ncbi:hypothetical protein ACH3VR_23165 [Microbacterium sp. B2969]|uniref:Uncharacterized protein n=1 Tax=Microbacterium alkaliflavum TaxID=3248839 RepID=A0ABW7QEF0_9MICO
MTAATLAEMVAARDLVNETGEALAFAITAGESDQALRTLRRKYNAAIKAETALRFRP